MANIFKTTLKKDIIADIANNNIREIRFPITKFWATRLAYLLYGLQNIQHQLYHKNKQQTHHYQHMF